MARATRVIPAAGFLQSILVFELRLHGPAIFRLALTINLSESSPVPGRQHWPTKWHFCTRRFCCWSRQCNLAP